MRVFQRKISLGNAEVFVEHFRFDGAHRPLKPTKEKKLDIDWSSFVEIWKKRKEAIDAAAQTSLFTSPSAVADKEKMPQNTFPETEGTGETSKEYPQYAAIMALSATVCWKHGISMDLPRASKGRSVCRKMGYYLWKR